MKLNCQVFKEEISIVHLNRQVAHFKSVLQDSYDKVLLVKLTRQVLFGKPKGNQQVKSLELSQQFTRLRVKPQVQQYVGKLHGLSQRMFWLL